MRSCVACKSDATRLDLRSGVVDPSLGVSLCEDCVDLAKSLPHVPVESVVWKDGAAEDPECRLNDVIGVRDRTEQFAQSRFHGPQSGGKDGHASTGPLH